MENIWRKTEPNSELQLPSTILAHEIHFLRKNNMAFMQLDHNTASQKLKGLVISLSSKWLCVHLFNFPPRF